MWAEPRLLVVSPDWPPSPGGIQLLMHRVSRNMTRVRPLVVTLESPSRNGFDDREAFEVVRSTQSRGGRQATIGALGVRAIREALRFRPDVVLSAHVVTAPATALIRRALGVPVVQYLHAVELDARPGLTRFALGQADLCIAVSRHTARLAELHGAQPERIRQISPGVDLPASDPGLRAARPTILTVASLDYRYKGHDVLARRAAARVRTRAGRGVGRLGRRVLEAMAGGGGRRSGPG